MVKKRAILIWAVTLITMGSGLVNLFSVMRPSLPGRITLLREVFALEFLHLSRFLTLLIGFVLIISSINIYKRKKRAFQLVCLLAFLSIVFHLTKDFSYEEALFSTVVLGVLIWSRKNFTVKSSIPNFRLALLRFSIAIIIVFVYGVAGFWFLDKREFGINFTLADSIVRTLWFLIFQGDSEIVPRTHFAHWFIDSLYFIALIALAYSLFSLFRPVRYKFGTLPYECERAKQILEKYGRQSLDYFKLWPDKSYFFSPSKNSFLAYRVGANFAVVLGDPVGPENEIEETIRIFSGFCDENDWGLAFHQTLLDFLPIYTKLGFHKLKIGDFAIVDLTKFTLDGKAGRELRQTANKVVRAGIHTVIYDPPIPSETLKQAKEVSDDWLQIAGRRERTVTLGLFEPEYVRTTPILAAVDQQGKIQAFLNIIPSYRKGEATIDLIRRRSDSPNGIMDYLLAKLFPYLKEKGFQTFSLGLAPMSGFQENEDPSIEERAIHYFFQHMNFLFSFKGLHQYKAKYASWWEPRYIIYQNALDLARHAIAITIVSKI